MKFNQEIRQNAQVMIRKFVKPGDTITCILRHVSKSGSLRAIDFYKIDGKGKWWLSGMIGHVLEFKRHKKGGLSISGGGMDMGFSVVYDLARVLWPSGDGKYKTGRNGDKGIEKDGGYLLKSEWL